MGSDSVVKKVKNVWDNRENKFNYEHHKPHFAIEFEGHTKEKPDSLKINLSGDKSTHYEQLGLWLKANGKGQMFIFAVETGDYEGKAWKAIRSAKTMEGKDVLDGAEPIKEAPAVTPPPPPVAKPQAPPPVATTPPKAPAPRPTGSWIAGVCLPETQEFWAEKTMVERLGMARWTAFNAAVSLLAANPEMIQQYSEDASKKGADISLAIEIVNRWSDELMENLMASYWRDRCDHAEYLLSRCTTQDEVSMILSKSKRELPEGYFIAICEKGEAIYNKKGA